ncbi:peptidase M6 [Desulfonema ishimotonii]|uniref:Peptidase M6 n=1 Tax=Desulfonema ishimotonii TaxID=45657 RepID=A0A401FWJ6_9BACT|nr:M6 family metalloprotease domain-containing protein [Desulfonema ishimotonii]GBC61304.1 peptidase M6 [Desulfonema ishimotonii]
MSVIFGHTRTFPQGNGPDIRLRVYGDEFYARYETPEGYTVVYDPDLERYCYAIRVSGHLVSSGTPVIKRPPQGLRRHLQEDKTIRNEKFRKRHAETYPASAPPAGITGTKGPDGGLLSGRRITRGKVTGLTIIVNFKDEKAAIDNALVEALLNADDYNGSRNHCSVREYYLKMSGGRLEYTNVVVGPVTLKRNRAYYINNSFVGEALDMVVNDLKVDLAQFDSRDEGIVDAVSFLYAGRSVYENNLWPHNWRVEWAVGRPVRYGGITFNQYMMTGLGRRPVDLCIGTFCHETGHLLCRFPDLYDYGTRDGDSDPSAGMGVYCLMASGNHLDYGKTPSPICAYLRDLAGWTDREILLNQPGTFRARHGDYGTLFKYETDRPNEYFLVENRSNLGPDAHLPDSGLAVYHCDPLGSNEWQSGSADRHYQCALIQADGSLDLETNRNSGDTGDLFAAISGVALSHDTTPHSKAWDGTESGLSLLDVSAAGEVITFKSGRAGGQGDTDVSDTPLVVREIFPDLLIPDDDPDGIASILTVEKSGKIKSMKLCVDISHTYIGDLEVSLETPSGGKIMLHNRQWGSDDNLCKTFDSDVGLARLKGSPMQGDWVLRVRDMAEQDTGRLNQWKLIIEYEPSERVIQVEAESGLKIPDADWKGISSVIPIDQEGRAKDIRVSVEIAHTYIGDLQIALISPSGQGIVLMPFGEGKNKVNVRRTYDSASHEGLAAMVRAGQLMQGDWILQVIDNAPGDSGTLKRWTLALTC